MQSDGNAKRRRHVPVRGASNVYKSQRADGSWVYEIRHPRNAAEQRLFEVVGTRLDAAKARAREVHGDSAPRVTSVGITLAQVVEDWQHTRQMKPRSREAMDTAYRVHIEPVLGRRRVRDIDKRDVQAWLAGLSRKDGRSGDLAPSTRLFYYSTLCLILAHGVEMGVLGAVPVLDRKHRPKPSPNRTRILSAEEEQLLLAYCGSVPWMKPIITVALHQALRLGEVSGLHWQDVDFAAGTVTVRHNMGRDGILGTPKGGSEATIPLTPAARHVLLELRVDGGGGEGLIFRNRQGESRRTRDIQRAMQRAVKRADLKDGVSFHCLRHTGISRIANHPRIPLVQVRDFARHSNISITQGYVHRIDSVEVTEAFGEALTQAPAQWRGAAPVEKLMAEYVAAE